MKSEVIKCILRTYIKERDDSMRFKNVACYLSEAPEYIPESLCPYKAYEEYMSGEPLYHLENRANDLLIAEPQAAEPHWDELNAPLEPEVERLAIGVGHRLMRFADEFDLNIVNNHDPANGNEEIKFKNHVIRVPFTCDCIQIPIVRNRAASGAVNARWTTINRSAKAGIHYVNSEGNVSFDQSEEEKIIEVKMISDREEKKDICFTVELFDARGTFNTLTVYIVDDSNMYPEEKHFINNIFRHACAIPMPEIVTHLVDTVITRNTFNAALQYLCSNADSISKEFALASELFRLTMCHAPLRTLTNAFCDFFSYYPELEDKTFVF